MPPYRQEGAQQPCGQEAFLRFLKVCVRAAGMGLDSHINTDAASGGSRALLWPLVVRTKGSVITIIESRVVMLIWLSSL